ncbi:hypothetical protein P152DRAFT_277717 [Eremomyces bilateralis CBS 781.70]|uniref:Fatty acid desaturase domain-containing protein n=1 Tax=Eremomyces bilateralis CBS 781.70 TaxID=1392243 RepID=A0A6G1G9D7_9PEZI|nr:uncharacterized protein P152DRAFT_277717 [Eremomyces bilateralis CBS 781.70]KAF1814546.1 hypothetical protein P152DRAFT_277717 [Eremomyces bilateralis CBS 781.70]
MASTTARPRRAGIRRTITSDSAPSSSAPSVTVSPLDSPLQSSSSTSLSSLGSVDDVEVKAPAALVDTYGNKFEIPDYTIKQIRDAIPAHCLERSALRSLGYVARDIAGLAITFYVFHNYATPELVPSTALRGALWAGYTVIQGLFGTGLWVLAHECGHQSFSTSKILNDTVGWILHSWLLVPYFSWKLSHSKHHKATGHMDRDMVFVPRTREDQATRMGKMVHELSELMEETPIYSALMLFGQQIGGFPLYLLANATGHNYHEGQVEGKGKGMKNGFLNGVNHYLPSSPLYERKDEHLILLSDLGLGIVLSIVFFLGKRFGWFNIFVWYIVPYLWVNHWLVAITYLQHTDPSLPHYDATTWTFTRGAAATIDRDFGFIGRHIFHGIIETHVLHHYVSLIPFYNADEASEAIKKVMGKHYRSDTKHGMFGFLYAMWKSTRWCQWVEPNADAEGEGKGVMFFRNVNGHGVRPTKLAPSGETALKRPTLVVGSESDHEAS